MQYKAIIFDLDGVIISTDDFHYTAWKKVADKMNVHFDETINDRLRGVSRMESLNIILENYNGVLSEKEKLELAEEKNEIYKSLLARLTPESLEEEVKTTLHALKNKGIKMAIGSSSKNAKYILERIGLEGFFDAVSDGTNITRSKPFPDVFLMAADFLGNEYKDCLVVEDAEAGIEAGLAAGMDTAAMGFAARCKTSTYKINGFQELLGIVLAE